MHKHRAFDIIDMISWLRDKFVGDGYTVHDQYDGEPALPIHLYCVKPKGKTKESLVILVAAATRIGQEYFQKLCFFQSYLSLYRYMGAKELKLVLAIPQKAKITREEKSDKYGHKEIYSQDSYAKRGFGLLRIKAPTKGGRAWFKYVYRPITLRNRMEGDFAKGFYDWRKGSKAVSRFFNIYIDEAVEGIAGANPVRFDERNIDRKLLEYLTKLTSLSYAKELGQMANEYLRYEKDDYSFAKEWVRRLWDPHFDVSYPHLHERLESLLKELYPKYRDHLLHQFQVFLLGSIVMDCLTTLGKPPNADTDELGKGWLLAATLHDFAQAVQKYDDWARDFVKESLGIDKPGGSLELKTGYVESAFSSSVEHIISCLENCFCDFAMQDRTENYNAIRRFFHYQITDKKNHAVLSSLSLLKRLEGVGEFHTVILPSATAIAIHDDEIWQTLNGTIQKPDEHECIEKLCTMKPLSRLELETQPLSFLLILCDNIQDWGRHFRDKALEEGSGAANIGLRSLNCKGDRITIQLFVNVNSNSLGFLKHKADTLQLVKNLLRSSSPHFVIEFWDRGKDEKLDMDVEIGD